jgi:hypothetical protein
MGFAYTLCMFVASLSTEVVDLKASPACTP